MEAEVWAHKQTNIYYGLDISAQQKLRWKFHRHKVFSYLYLTIILPNPLTIYVFLQLKYTFT